MSSPRGPSQKASTQPRSSIILLLLLPLFLFISTVLLLVSLLHPLAINQSILAQQTGKAGRLRSYRRRGFISSDLNTCKREFAEQARITFEPTSCHLVL